MKVARRDALVAVSRGICLDDGARRFYSAALIRAFALSDAPTHEKAVLSEAAQGHAGRLFALLAATLARTRAAVAPEGVVQADDGRWIVQLDGAKQGKGYSTKKEAIPRARHLARRAKGEYVVHRRDGSVSGRRSYAKAGL